MFLCAKYYKTLIQKNKDIQGMTMYFRKRLLIFFYLIGSYGCTTTPTGIKPVSNFEIQKYLGTWYEIARLDHSFERNLIDVYANYSLQDDGGIKVINRGKNIENNKWKEAIGKAYFIKEKDIGSLKVSFFWPFYGAYHIAKLDKDYTMALVIGPNLNYAWVLSRSENPNKKLCQDYFNEASQLGIDYKKWIKIRKCK